MFRCFFGFLIFFGLARAVTLDEVLGLALANTYQLLGKVAFARSSKAREEKPLCFIWS